MTEHATAPYTPATPEVAWDRPVPTLRAYRDQADVDALIDASFVDAHMRPCVNCGAMIGSTEGVCYPCSQGNRARGPIYGASLAGHTPAPGAALRAVEAVWLTPAAWPEQAEVAAANSCHDCAAVADRSDALAAENSDLARQIVALRGQLAALRTRSHSHDQPV